MKPVPAKNARPDNVSALAVAVDPAAEEEGIAVTAVAEVAAVTATVTNRD